MTQMHSGEIPADKLETIFALQHSLDTEIAQKRGLTGIQPEEWIQKEALAIISELAELLAEVNFKWWKNPKEIDFDKVKGELIDLLHFVLSSCLKVGMGAEEVYSRYIEKNKENFDRQYGKSLKKGYAVDELEGKK